VHQGHAARLPFPDESFDAVLCVNMLEALPDPSRGLLEMRRVLQPGGRVVVAHTDYESQVYACTDRVLARRINLVFSEARMPGYEAADGQMGRHLWGLLNAAGFRETDVRVLPLVETEYAEPHLGWQLTRFSPKWIADRGLAPDEVERWCMDLQERSDRGAYLYSQNMYVCTGRLNASFGA
jgi:SAM-dependent methyltransferase